MKKRTARPNLAVVSYNFLNLPDSFNLGSRNTSNNLYRADGIKIRKHNNLLDKFSSQNTEDLRKLYDLDE